MLTVLASMAWAGCSEPTINADLHDTMTRANDAYAALDEVYFGRALLQIEGQTVCLTEVVAPSYAASIHRMLGIGAFLSKDFADADAHFGASRTIEPTYRFPEAIAPEGNPIWTRFSGVDLQAGQPIPLPIPRSGSYRIDGRVGDSWDPRLPAILQRLDDEQRVRSTEFLEPGADLPPDGERIRGPRKVPVLLVGGIAALAGSAASVAGAHATKAAFESASTKDEVDANYRATGALNATAGILGAAGVGLVTAHFVIR